MGCDTLVALARASADGVTLFAKNSDRPPRECQRIVQLPAPSAPAPARGALPVHRDPAGRGDGRRGSARSRTGSGASSTASTSTASRSATRRSSRARRSGASGLLGMDLVRLGLERGRSGRRGARRDHALLEEHGQGGSGLSPSATGRTTTRSSIADPRDAPGSSRRGPALGRASRSRDVGNISNGLAIGDRTGSAARPT